MSGFNRDEYRAELRGISLSKRVWHCGFNAKNMSESQEQIFAIASALSTWLEPKSSDDNDCDLTAWRLAQVLEEKLSEVEFSTRVGVGADGYRQNLSLILWLCPCITCS